MFRNNKILKVNVSDKIGKTFTGLGIFKILEDPCLG
jgi:hypothetical protein